MYGTMNSFTYALLFSLLGLLTNAFPVEHEIGSSSTPEVEFSPFQGIIGIGSSIAENLRDAAKTTKTISGLVLNGDGTRTRGFWSWLSSCFSGGGGSKAPSKPPSSKSPTPLPRANSQAPPPPAKQVSRSDVILTIGTTNDFNTKVKPSKTPFMVMYTFEGCGACTKLSPVLEDYIVSLNGKMLYAKVNVDNVNVPDKGSISSYPTIQFFHNGQSSKLYGPSDAQHNYKTLIAPYVK